MSFFEGGKRAMMEPRAGVETEAEERDMALRVSTCWRPHVTYNRIFPAARRTYYAERWRRRTGRFYVGPKIGQVRTINRRHLSTVSGTVAERGTVAVLGSTHAGRVQHSTTVEWMEALTSPLTLTSLGT
ncbi:hypothetical protein G7046_g5787 [Stylonectria norvegica]|nr:hypothetical protein G7046_g5787 [Stylonectria norvegica]